MVFKLGGDAGHAGFGVTSGKRVPDGSMYEWDFNNAVMVKIEQKLKQYENTAFVRLDDRTGKKDIPLKERTDKANRENCTALVSMHANAFGTGFNDVNGTETFLHPRGSQKSLELATAIQRHLIRDLGTANRGVKRADFHMVRESEMPAVLVEAEFMTNKTAAEKLKSEAFREKVAEATMKGLAEVFNLKKKPAPKPPAPKPTPTKPAPKAKFYRVVTGSFGDRENAEKRMAELKAKGFDSFIDVE